MIEVSVFSFTLPLKIFKFPAGEIGVNISEVPSEVLRLIKESGVVTFNFLVKNPSSDSILAIPLVKNALTEFLRQKGILKKCDYKLILPYMPYSRQDRVCATGDSFSMKVFGEMINFFQFDEVVTYDPHSDVTKAVINNLTVINNVEVLRETIGFGSFNSEEDVFISPDAGANKKTYDLVKSISDSRNNQKFTVFRADKLRDTTTGNILETIVYADRLDGKNVYVADDVCEGGKTFIELAKVVKVKGCKSFNLFVTHGFFSKGVKVLFDNGIDRVFTTDTVCSLKYLFDKFPKEKDFILQKQIAGEFRIYDVC